MEFSGFFGIFDAIFVWKVLGWTNPISGIYSTVYSGQELVSVCWKAVLTS
jgi:hypothetical protein